MTIFKECRVITSYTKEAVKRGQLFKTITTGEDVFIASDDKPLDDRIIPQHLYITIDERPKAGDVYAEAVMDMHLIHTMTADMLERWCSTEDKEDNFRRRCKKVIATTDRELINHINLETGYTPPLLISTGFVQQYAEANGKIDKVHVAYELDEDIALEQIRTKGRSFIYSAYLPKKGKDNTVIIKLIEKTYDKYEVMELLRSLNNQINITSGGLALGDRSLDEWIKENL